MYRLAFVSLHGCPVARLGEKDSGGMNVYVLQLAREFACRGISVDVFTRAHDPADPTVVDLQPGARVVHLKAGPYATSKRKLFDYIPAFLRELSRFHLSEETSYDLVHSHYWLSGRVGMNLSKMWAVPHVTTFHTLAKTKMKALAGERELARRGAAERLIIHDVDAMIVSTEEEKHDLVHLYGAQAAKINVVPAGVDLELFQPMDRQAAREVLGIREERIILYVGRIEPLKGLDLLVETAAQMDTGESVRMIVVGADVNGDREIDRVKELAKERDLEDQIDFVGQVEHSDLPLYYNAADVCVVPSYYESFGLVALESMACGTPVVASRVGGLSTIINHGSTGYLKSWRCPEAFANSVEMIISSDGLQQSMGEAARKRAEGMGWGNVAAMMWDEYAALTENPAKDDNKC